MDRKIAYYKLGTSGMVRMCCLFYSKQNIKVCCPCSPWLFLSLRRSASILPVTCVYPPSYLHVGACEHMFLNSQNALIFMTIIQGYKAAPQLTVATDVTITIMRS